MKSIFYLCCLLISLNTNAQDNRDLKASKLFFFNDDFGAIIISDNTIALTENGGYDWAKINIETNEGLLKILFTSLNNGWIISDSTIYKSMDGGHTWNSNRTFNVNQQYSLTFISSNLGFIGGQTTAASGYESIIYYTLDGGENWNNSIIDSNFNAAILDVTFANDSVGIAVSSFTIYRTNDSGISWNKLPMNFFIGAGNPNSGTMLNENLIILTAWYPYVVAEGYLLSSLDGGLSWGRYGNGQDFKWGIRDAYILNQDSIWLTTGESTYFTENAGMNWNTIDVKLEEFSFTTNKTAYGIYNKYLLRTEDGWITNNIVDSTVTDVKESTNFPESIKLYQNYPNPFNPTTKIKYSIASEGNSQKAKLKSVTLKIFDILGREIATLVDEKQKPGNYEVGWNANKYPSGVYFYRLQVYAIKNGFYSTNSGNGDYVETKKMILLR